MKRRATDAGDWQRTDVSSPSVDVGRALSGPCPLMVNLVFETIGKINNEGVTVLIVEQNVHRTLQLAQEAYILENGRITLRGIGKDLLENPHIKKAYLGL